jgi:hypothetical protein
MAPNKVVQDVIPKGKRTIRDIPLSRAARSATTTVRREPVAMPSSLRKEPRSPSISTGGVKSAGHRSSILWILVALSILALLYALMSFFARATVTVVPQTALIALDESFTAERGATTGVPFEVMTLSLAAEREIPATRKEEVSRKASGTITVYNAYSSAPQRLIVNTRFEAADGRIYKIDRQITVPGQTTKNGVTTPGSVEAVVYAESPGERYNMKIDELKGDFTIPGFKGEPRYKGFYARLSSDITGGMQGTVQKAESTLQAAAEAELRAQLEKDIIAKAFAEKPDSYVLTAGSYWIEYKTLPETSAGAEAVRIGLSATLRGIIFNEEKLAAYFKSKKAADAPLVEPLSLTEGDNFSLVVDLGKTQKPWESQIVKVTVGGEAKLVSSYDTSLLLGTISGITKKAFSEAVASVPGIQSADLMIQPFGKTRIPDDVDKIRIVEQQ